jgi:alpha-ketoglutarate-dependent taurine dioxygenase
MDLLNKIKFDHLEYNKNNIFVVHAIDKNIDISTWFASVEEWFTKQLHQHGAILLRDFPIHNVDDFEFVIRQISINIATFDEESSPRHCVKGAVFTSTDYPKDYPIQFHNEFSYSDSWPMKIFFYCKTPANKGGNTPIADSRKVLSRLKPETRAKFEQKGVLYNRLYSPNYGVSWQTAFATNSREEVSKRCNSLGIQTTWDNNTLHTSQRGPAILCHPITKENVWFNHGFFFNPHSFEPIDIRQIILQQDEKDLLTNTKYGDGSVIEASTIEEIRKAYEAEKIEFDWQPGDILIIDNMLCAHSRQPYEGNREVFTIMSDKFDRKD